VCVCVRVRVCVYQKIKDYEQCRQVFVYTVEPPKMFIIERFYCIAYLSMHWCYTHMTLVTVCECACMCVRATKEFEEFVGLSKL